MAKRKRPPARAECPQCGAEFAAGRAACPECGSDAETGWRESEDIDLLSLELPDADIPDSYEELVGAGRPRPATNLGWLWLLVALFVAAVLAPFALGVL